MGTNRVSHCQGDLGLPDVGNFMAMFNGDDIAEVDEDKTKFV